MVRTGVITDELWELIEPVLPSDKGRRGRRWRDHRQVLEAIAWRFGTGAPWRDVPAEFGPWQTLWKRHRRWSGDGTYQLIFEHVRAGQDGAGKLDWLVPADSTIVRAHQHSAGAPAARGAGPNDKIPGPGDHGIGRSRGGLTTKVHALAGAGIHPVALLLPAGQAGDNPRLVPLLDALAQAGYRAAHLLADKAYPHPPARRELRRRRIRHTIPERFDQVQRRKDKGPAGGRPPRFDPGLYKERNTVERGFGRFKQWRGIATRDDKYARTYPGGVLLAATVILARP